MGSGIRFLLQSNVLVVQDKALRLRQHINPLKRQHQVPIDPPDWHSVYGNARLPLVLDIGCAGGRYLLALANKLEGINLLGIDIREPVRL